MNWARTARLATMAAMLLPLTAESILAQTARTGGGANSQLQVQVQQLAAEKVRMDAESAKLKKDLEDAHKELISFKAAQRAIDLRVKESTTALAQGKTQRDSDEEQLRQMKDNMEQLIAKFRETAQTLREAETDRANTKQALATRDQQLTACVDHNLALYKLNNEVLAHLENEGFWSHVAAAEPFTKLKRIQNQNLVDDYKSRADDQRATPANN